MSLADLATKQAVGLPVTAWVESWRAGKGRITAEAIATVTDVMKTDFASDRRSDGSGRFRPSMIGNPCQRAQVLSYLGVPQRASVEVYTQMADAGSWLHYKWQAEGLSAGWLTGVEVQIEIPEWGLRGSVDGIMSDGSIFEAKTLGNDKYYGRRGTKPVSEWDDPVLEHVRQVDAYMYATGSHAASLVYINRDSGAFREFRVLRDTNRMASLSHFIQEMIAMIDSQKIPDILPGCLRVMRGDVIDDCTKAEVKEWSKQHDWCNYHEVCAAARFPEVHQIGIPASAQS